MEALKQARNLTKATSQILHVVALVSREGFTGREMSSYTISSLIEKLDARDKDERFMAMHDLSQDLDRDNIRLDGEMERRVVAMILKHLEDPGTDVKQQAVRTIASLARKVQESQLEEIADKLATHILNKTDEEKRDIGSIGLKTLVGVLTLQTAPAVLKRVTPKLQQGINQSTEVAHYCLEILNDLLKGFGMIMVRDLASIQSSILPLLSSEVAATRKRSSVCVASLAICAPDQLFNTLSTSPLTSHLSHFTSPLAPRGPFPRASHYLRRPLPGYRASALPLILPLFLNAQP